MPRLRNMREDIVTLRYRLGNAPKEGPDNRTIHELKLGSHLEYGVVGDRSPVSKELSKREIEAIKSTPSNRHFFDGGKIIEMS